MDALRQIATTSLFIEEEQRNSYHKVPTIHEPDKQLGIDVFELKFTILMTSIYCSILESPLELKKFDTLKVDTLNVIDIMSLTDEETDREIHQIDINQEIIIPKIKPTSLFSDVDDEDQVDSQEQQRQNKLKRQRTSVNQNRRDYDTLLMETSLIIIDPQMSPPPVPPFSPPPLTPDSPHPPHLNPNVVTSNNVPSTLALSLPINSTISTSHTTRAEASTSHVHKHHHKHSHHKHSHHHQLKDGAKHPPTESEIVLSPAKLQ